MFNKLLSVAAVVASGALVVSQGISPQCSRQYTVKPGDYCDKISAEQNVSSFQLASVNAGIINRQCTNLVPGQIICLGLEGQDCTNVHVVKEGDFCALVAYNAGITIGDLLTNNPNINAACTNIGIGQVLCVAPVVNATAVPLPSSTTTGGQTSDAVYTTSEVVTSDTVHTTSAVPTSDAVYTTSRYQTSGTVYTTSGVVTSDTVYTTSGVITSDAVYTTSGVVTSDTVYTTSTVLTSDKVYTTSRYGTTDEVYTTSRYQTTDAVYTTSDHRGV